MLTHPEIPTCVECQAWVFDKHWKKVKRGGKPVKRQTGQPLPCGNCPKSRNSQPNPDAELSQKNYAAYIHYLACKASNRFPNDPIVQRNALLFRWVEECLARDTMAAIPSMLGGLQRLVRGNG